MWHLSIQLIIVCVYIALLFGISFYVKRRADKGSTEYLFAGRKLRASLSYEASKYAIPNEYDKLPLK